jgi:hypothetical protein
VPKSPGGRASVIHEPIVLVSTTIATDGEDPRDLLREALAFEVMFADEAEIDEDRIRRLIASLLRSRGCVLEGISSYFEEDHGPPFWAGHCFIGSRRRGTLFGTVFRAAEEVSELIEASASGELTRTTAPQLVAGGHAASLIGQMEGPWLEAKRLPYDLGSEAGRHELAKDVASFANAREGGTIVLGMGTKRGPDGDRISRLNPVVLGDVSLARYRHILRERVFPAPEGVAFSKVPSGGGLGFVLIGIPPQPEELRPFLVAGTLMGGRVVGSYMSLPQRVGEDTSWASPASIHGLIIAGRAALMGPRTEPGAWSRTVEGPQGRQGRAPGSE